MATLLLLSPALGVRGCACVITCDIATLQPSIHPYSKKHLPKKPGGGWMGGEGCWMWAGRGGALPSAPPSPARGSQPARHRPLLLTRMSVWCWVAARGLAGGCHRAQIQTVPGVSRECWDCPWEHFVAGQRGRLSSCLAPAWHGKEEARSPLSVSCLLAKPGLRSWRWAQPCRGSCVLPGAGTG